METLVYFMAFASAFLALQVIIGAGKQAGVKVKTANERMRLLDSDDPHDEVLRKIREKRGVDARSPLNRLTGWLDKMVIQSGLPLGKKRIYMAMPLTAVVLSVIALVTTKNPYVVAAAAVFGLAAPVLLAVFCVKRRRNKAISQLPEALDTIIRSLQAGHPISVALALVGREMPDPIGSEFGIASDEVAYGASASAAIQRVANRVGHMDFELFSAMIRVQEKTGGNLTELLRGSAATIRQRQKMRLKIQAASAEGRTSAKILNITPIGLFFAVNLMSPGFYGEVMHAPIITKGLWGVVIWMIIGNLIMRKMINFKI